ncbi:MAG: diacylglycerol kinase catalytic region [Polyangiaceae bacterium]|jgi:diacylglycerol kinase family enzyme|nr:diacylglycerol kinase catalytic region [Polyangiaceae bacterium]
MRVALFHNTSAGSEDHTDEELTDLIQSVGGKVIHVVGRLADLTAALQEQPCDFVVIAGGDGTVGRTACELSGWQIPLAILPLGTANNTARSLDLPLRMKKLARGWSKATKVPFDLGLLDDGAQRTRFAECAGWGAFAQTIVAAKRRDSDGAGTVKQTLRRDRKLFRNLVRKLETRPYKIEVDGRDCSGDYVLVEVMNLSLLGPQLPLSPSSDPGDGQIELVLVGDAERAALERVAKSGVADGGGYRVERGRHVRVEADDALLHRDGHVVRYPRGTRGFDFQIEPAAVHYLR